MVVNRIQFTRLTIITGPGGHALRDGHEKRLYDIEIKEMWFKVHDEYEISSDQSRAR